MRAVKDVLIVLLLGFLVFMTYVQEDDVVNLKRRAFLAENGLIMAVHRVQQLESGLSVGYDLSAPLAAAAVVRVNKEVPGSFGRPRRAFSDGSGVFVSGNMLLTAKHVVKNRIDNASVTVITANEVTFQSVEILEDADDDMALIVIDGTYSHYLEVGSRPRLGDHLMCIGSPFAHENRKLLVSWARVAGENWKNSSFIYDGFCWYGHSGGPVIKDGLLVGITWAKLSCGDYPLGFAIYLDRLDPELRDRI